MATPRSCFGPCWPLFVQLLWITAWIPSALGREQNIHEVLGSAGSIDFRLGSGAVAAASKTSSFVENFGKNLNLLPTPGKYLNSIMKSKTPDPYGRTVAKGRWSHRTLLPTTFFLGMLCISSYICFMMPNLGSGSGNFNYRIPPAWSPETDHTYSFRAFMTDISLWIMLTDLRPEQQCAAIIMRLGGGARDGTHDHPTGDDEWRNGQRCDG